MHCEMPLISVILPVYNVSRFLRPCLDSLMAQTYPHFEVLLVNDGSTDDSGTICEEYAARDSRFRVYHKENGGVSSARNLGIQLAQGTYIAFVDSDDLIMSDYLEVLLRSMEENNADIVCCNYTVIDEAGAPITGHSRGAGGVAPNVKTARVVDSFDTIIADIHQCSEYYHTHVSAAMLRTQPIKELRFSHQLRHYEDGNFLFEVFIQTRPNVVLTDYAGYLCRIRLSSVTRAVTNFALRPREDRLVLCRNQFAALHQAEHPYAQAFLERYAESIHALAYAAAQPENTSERKRCRQVLSEHIQYILHYRSNLSKGAQGRIALYRYLPWLHGVISRLNERFKG